MPDQIWIADWNGKANTCSSYIRSTGWQPYGRAKQYQGGHNETWGGVRINIDRNYLNLRTPKLPGASTRRRQPEPRATRARRCLTRCCTPKSINRSSYRKIDAKSWRATIITCNACSSSSAQYPYAVTGSWNPQTSGR